MDELEQERANCRRLEEELRRSRLALWDRFFMAALASTLHHGKLTGVAAAAEVADEALRVRDLRMGGKA